jgi:HK97 family phage portal protein
VKLAFWRSPAEPERKSILDDWPWETSIPESLLLDGKLLTVDQAVGLPALLACLFRIGDGVGMMPQLVYRRRSRERDPDSWQWRLLHDRPNAESGPAAFRGDLALSIAASGMAFVRKFKARGQVRELVPLDTRKVKPRRSGGRLVFDDRTDGRDVTRDQREIIYIRGLAMHGSVEGLSRIGAARMAIAAGLKRQAFEAGHLDNGAFPGVILKFPERLSREQAQEWVEFYDAIHRGYGRTGKTTAIGGGAEIEAVPIKLADAQFVEANRLTVEYIAGLYGIPKRFVAPGGIEMSEAGPEARWQLVTFGLGPTFTAIDQAFNADPDLFPEAEDRFCEHLADALLKPDTRSRYEAYKAARQAGWLTANEIRALENYPAKEGGDELQQTPVGGAPNSDAAKALMALLQQDGPNEILLRALRRAHEDGAELDDETLLLIDLAG